MTGGGALVGGAERFAPYAPINSVLTVIRRFRERGLPEVLTAQEMTRLGVPEGNVSRTLQSLRFLGLLDEEGRRTTTFDSLRRASTSEYPDALGQIVKVAYGAIFEITDPSAASEVELQDAFRHFEPQAQRARMIALFTGLCREAELITGGLPERAPRRPRSSNAKPSSGSPPRHSRIPSVADDIPLAANLPKQALPDYRVLDALFQQLPQDGRWTKERRDRWLQAVTASVALLIEVVPSDEPIRMLASPRELPGGDASRREEPDGEVQPLGDE